MGIPNLLQGLKFCVEPGSIRDFSGQSLAIDLSGWLHKSVYSISRYYVEYQEDHLNSRNNSNDNNDDSSCYYDNKILDTAVRYVFKHCSDLLRYANVSCLYLVLDGVRCPLKTAGAHVQREEKRLSHLQQARDALNEGGSGAHAAAERHYQACIRIAPALANAVALRVVEQFASQQPNNNADGRDDGRIELVFSPYEADAQMVHLALQNKVQAIVTEDSDVLVYAAACHCLNVSILYKLHRRQPGSCDVVRLDRQVFSNNSSAAAAAKKKRQAASLEPFLQAFAQRERIDPGKGIRAFVQACVLTGCDYSTSQLKGVGLVLAFQHVARALFRSHSQRLSNIIRRTLPRKATAALMAMETNGTDTNVNNNNTSGGIADYLELLHKCEAVFYYHPVRDVDTDQIVWLQEPVISKKETSANRDKDQANDDEAINVNMQNNNNDRRVHMPDLSDFDDLSFLGKVEITKPDDASFGGEPTIRLLDPIDPHLVNYKHQQHNKRQDGQHQQHQQHSITRNARNHKNKNNRAAMKQEAKVMNGWLSKARGGSGDDKQCGRVNSGTAPRPSKRGAISRPTSNPYHKKATSKRGKSPPQQKRTDEQLTGGPKQHSSKRPIGFILDKENNPDVRFCRPKFDVRTGARILPLAGAVESVLKQRQRSAHAVVKNTSPPSQKAGAIIGSCSSSPLVIDGDDEDDQSQISAAMTNNREDDGSDLDSLASPRRSSKQQSSKKLLPNTHARNAEATEQQRPRSSAELGDDSDMESVPSPPPRFSQLSSTSLLSTVAVTSQQQLHSVPNTNRSQQKTDDVSDLESVTSPLLLRDRYSQRSSTSLTSTAAVTARVPPIETAQPQRSRFFTSRRVTLETTMASDDDGVEDTETRKQHSIFEQTKPSNRFDDFLSSPPGNTSVNDNKAVLTFQMGNGRRRNAQTDQPCTVAGVAKPRRRRVSAPRAVSFEKKHQKSLSPSSQISNTKIHSFFSRQRQPVPSNRAKLQARNAIRYQQDESTRL